MQKGFGALGIILVLVIITAIGGSVFLAPKYFSKPLQPKVTPLPSPTNPKTETPKPAPDETANSDSIGANWKTVKDRDGIFTFKLPEGWEYGTDIFTKSEDKSLREWITENGNFDFKINSEKEFSVNGNEAIIFEVEAAPHGRSLQAYLLKDEDTVVRLSANPIGRNNPDLPPFDEEIKNKFQRIVSTIQFLK